MLVPAILVLLVTPSDRVTFSGTVVADYYETVAQKAAARPYFSEPLKGGIVTAENAWGAEAPVPGPGVFALALPPGKRVLKVFVPSYALDDFQVPVEVTGEKPAPVDIHVALVVPDGPGIRGRVIVRDTGISLMPRMGKGRPGLGALD